jgi:hypothetical protein
MMATFEIGIGATSHPWSRGRDLIRKCGTSHQQEESKWEQQRNHLCFMEDFDITESRNGELSERQSIGGKRSLASQSPFGALHN